MHSQIFCSSSTPTTSLMGVWEAWGIDMGYPPSEQQKWCDFAGLAGGRTAGGDWRDLISCITPYNYLINRISGISGAPSSFVEQVAEPANHRTRCIASLHSAHKTERGTVLGRGEHAENSRNRRGLTMDSARDFFPFSFFVFTFQAFFIAGPNLTCSTESRWFWPSFPCRS